MVHRAMQARLVSAALALTLALAPMAMCVVGAVTATAQHDCRAAMNHESGGTTVGSSCCAADSPNYDAVLVSTTGSVVVAPALVPAGLFTPSSDSADSLRQSVTVDTDAQTPASTPTYCRLGLPHLASSPFIRD